jgi:hypothetical protein
VAESIQSREQAREHFRQDAAPVITFTAQTPPGESLSWQTFDVIVRNVGRGPALDVQIDGRDSVTTYTIRERLPYRPGVPLDSAFKEGIQLHLPLTLAPGDSLRLAFNAAFVEEEERPRLNRAINENDFGAVVATCRDVFGQQFESRVRLRANFFSMPVPNQWQPHPYGCYLGPLEYRRLS